MRLVALAVVALSSAYRAWGQEEGAITGGIELDLNSRYVFRGLALSQGAVVNPSVYVSRGPWTFSLWANFVARDRTNHGQINEVDPTLTYSTAWRGLTIEPSLTYYGLINQPGGASTAELGVRLALPLSGGFELFTNHGLDLHEFDHAWYGDLGVERTWQVSSGIELVAAVRAAGASRSFHEAYAGVTASGWSYVGIDLEARVAISASFFLRTHLALTSLRGRALRSNVDDPDLAAGGIGFGAVF